METSVILRDEEIIIEASPKDKIFQKQLKEQVAKSPLQIITCSEKGAPIGLSEDYILDLKDELSNLGLEVERIIEQIKNAIIVPESTVTPNRIFEDWYIRKGYSNILVYEIVGNGFYSFSREKVKNRLHVKPQFYISDKRGERICQANYSVRLSDENNIVLKVAEDKGYIFAIDEKIVL